MQSETLEQAQHAGKMGALQASQHADAERQEWSVEAAIRFLEFATMVAVGQPFLAEEAREWVERTGFPPPPDKRAWGHIARVLCRAGHIRAAGYAPSRSSNGSPKVLWEAA